MMTIQTYRKTACREALRRFFNNIEGVSNLQEGPFSFKNGASGSWAVALLACPPLSRRGFESSSGELS